MEWQAPSINGVVPAARNSHRAEPFGEDVVVFGGSGQSECFDNLFLFKTSTFSSNSNILSTLPCMD
jgi:hypothetical protein